MRTEYVRPMIDINTIISESFICNSNKTDAASIGTTGSPNESNQTEIQPGGPGIAGSKSNPFNEQDTNSPWED
ncbi:hypothetical protein [Prevotella histicola]|uniref:Uncharacterized protein n=1 Tax=Prevotella histicola F0411 TaxID=857291 RepID=G6AG61_9BACT|nr:hypothetical protein [Prevotella histicola]EHG16252.1 hypothetical protein HMPREF9138_01088 [Prevotella histicola F0411]QUB85096.1 hypothetical protein J5A62_09310 [Prevotella histicola]